MQNRTLDLTLTTKVFLLTTALSVVLPSRTVGQVVDPDAASAAADSVAVAETVHAYHAVLVAGDSTSALALLAPDAVILESGGIESRAEYRAHHLHSDIAFARSVTTERGAVRVTVSGDVAWASSTSTTKGEYRDRPINSAGAELMVLVRTRDGWRIAAIHWSSRNVRS